MSRVVDSIIIAGVVIAFTVVGGVGAYAKHWESQQPTISLNQAKVVLVEPYSITNELHWSSSGYRVYVEGEERPIDFPTGSWDHTVKEGGSVDVVARRSFPWPGLGEQLDGISIDDHK